MYNEYISGQCLKEIKTIFRLEIIPYTKQDILPEGKTDEGRTA